MHLKRFDEPFIHSELVSSNKNFLQLVTCCFLKVNISDVASEEGMPDDDDDDEIEEEFEEEEEDEDVIEEEKKSVNG